MPTIAESLQQLRDGRYFLKLRFGGGTNVSNDAADIDIREDSGGKNFSLALDRTVLVPRKAVDLIATAPNSQIIRGFVELIKSDGTVSSLVQAGGNVYSWDGQTTFTLVGTVPANARLRGGRWSTSQVDDKVLISDLALSANVHEWDGTTFQELSTTVTNFKARHILVDNERAFFGNVSAAGVETPHLIVGSARGTTSSATDLGTVTVSTRPSSGASESDAFYIPSPDLKPVNGLLRAFGLVLISTQEGQMWKLAGSTAKDFAIQGFYKDSFAAGEEAMIEIGNDVIFGRPGRIDTLVGSEAFGDVEKDDPSRPIAAQIESVKEWTAIYNPRYSRAYFWPKDGSELWVFQQSLYKPKTGGLADALAPPGVSPWMKWTTTLGGGDFRQTAVALLRHPADNLDDVFFGGSGGQIYHLEGDGTQDGGSEDISVERVTGFIGPPMQASYAKVSGYINHRKDFSSTLTITLEQHGVNYPNDETITLSVSALDNIPAFGGDVYFGGDFYFNTKFTGRIARSPWQAPGSSSFFKLKLSYTGTDPEIQEIGIYFEDYPET